MDVYMAGGSPKQKHDITLSLSLSKRERYGNLPGRRNPGERKTSLADNDKEGDTSNSTWRECSLGGARDYICQHAGGGVSVLESFYYVDEWTEKTIPLLHNFMLDSGAFTFFTNNMQLAWEDIIDRYAEFINKNGVKLFFELDIDKLIGYERVKKLRKRLQDKTNKQPIPVWHKSRGREEFLRMVDEFPYVSIGGIVSREIKATEYKFFPWFIQQAHKRGTKIHGLGFTNLEGLEKYHFDSVDSTAWVSGNRFGAACARGRFYWLRREPCRNSSLCGHNHFARQCIL